MTTNEKKLADVQADKNLAEAIKDLPRKRITNKDELEKWLSDEEK
ncbi:hypothetical protein [Lentilactobacillus buchneri]|nr:hypothetical protein [Lentilactobacillus buchneri]BEJ52501.1 hypothetical protein Ltb232_06770 [Lentilactobacillus buchneri subsp. silagei]GED90935.1 hypothetical protein LBSG162_00400 [Lentilactobacillus buchneri subsp. silagei]GED93919.1 hypothetical protein LBSP_04790 [Lentilactobacillus buchneri subsp. silagei]